MAPIGLQYLYSLASDPSIAADEAIATDPSHVGGEKEPGINCLHVTIIP